MQSYVCSRLYLSMDLGRLSFLAVVDIARRAPIVTLYRRGSTTSSFSDARFFPLVPDELIDISSAGSVITGIKYIFVELKTEMTRMDSMRSI